MTELFCIARKVEYLWDNLPDAEKERFQDKLNKLGTDVKDFLRELKLHGKEPTLCELKDVAIANDIKNATRSNTFTLMRVFKEKGIDVVEEVMKLRKRKNV